MEALVRSHSLCALFPGYDENLQCSQADAYLRGCVTGYQLQNIRNNLEDPERPGVYRWDFLDGYEGGEKGSLDKHPELQEKVRRVITQGFIDPEDFNGVSSRQWPVVNDLNKSYQL
jgi:hypothetical protein